VRLSIELESKVKQHSIEELGEILKAKGGQFFERPAGDDVVTRVYISSVGTSHMNGPV
jgi:hypothetical protein